VRKRWADIQPIAELREPVWVRQRGETVKAFQAFACYRDMGADRSLRAAAAKLGKHESLLQDWAKRWRWRTRVDLWDAHCETLGIEAQERAITAMNERWASLAMEGWRKLMQRLIGDDIEGVQALNPSLLSPADISRMAEVLSKLEARARAADDRGRAEAQAPVQILLAPGLLVQNVRDGADTAGRVELQQAPSSCELPAA
jgi:hypothetical protein